MADLTGPIRKLESRVRHHEAIAALDTEAAEQAGDGIEEALWRTSAAEHARQAEEYAEAVEVLRSFAMRRAMR